MEWKKRIGRIGSEIYKHNYVLEELPVRFTCKCFKCI